MNDLHSLLKLYKLGPICFKLDDKKDPGETGKILLHVGASITEIKDADAKYNFAYFDLGKHTFKCCEWLINSKIFQTIDLIYQGSWIW